MEGIQVKTEPSDVDEYPMQVDEAEDDDGLHQNATDTDMDSEEESFTSNIEFEEHLIKLEPQDEVDCSPQSAQSSAGGRSKNRPRGLNDGRSSRNFKCDVCGMQYAHAEMFAWHMKHCHGSNPLVKIVTLANKNHSYQCTLCETECMKIVRLIRHLHEKHHVMNVPFQCKVCTKPFIRSDDRKKHQIKCINRKIHSRKMNQKCEQCNLRFSYPEMLTWHVDHCHGDNPIVKVTKIGDKCSFQCLLCQTAFQDSNSVILHLHKKHQLMIFPFPCSVCGKKFLTKYSLSHHQFTCKAPVQYMKPFETIFITEMPVKLELADEDCSPQRAQDDETEEQPVKLEPADEDCSPQNAQEDEEQPVKLADEDCSPQNDEPTSSNQSEGKIVKNLKCEECGIVYGVPEMLAWHTEYCHGPEATVKVLKIGERKTHYQCNICASDVYYRIDLVIQHLIREHNIDKLPFHCSGCDKTFANKCLREIHQHTCKNKNNVDNSVFKKIKCDECDTSYAVPEIFTWHTENFHGSDPTVKVIKVGENKYFQCLPCKSVMYTGLDLIMQHLSRQHKLDKLPFVCNICDKSFVSSFNLGTHQRKCKTTGTVKNHNSRILKCQECGINFAFPEMLTWHIENCHGVNPTIEIIKIGDKKYFQCVFCDTKFIEMYRIIYHLRSKHKLMNLPYHCNVCDKGFIRRPSFIDHKSICKIRPAQNHQKKTKPLLPFEEVLIPGPEELELPIKFEPRKTQKCYTKV